MMLAYSPEVCYNIVEKLDYLYVKTDRIVTERHGKRYVSNRAE